MHFIKNFFFILTLFFPALCCSEIYIATVMPKSGDHLIWGNELEKGAEIAVNEINKKGGLRGEKLILSNLDDACSQNLSLSTAQMLSIKTYDKPSLVIGPYCPENLDQIAQTYAKAKIFQIVPSVLNKNQADKNYTGVIKLFGNFEQIGSDFFEFYNSHFASKRVALVSSGKMQSLDQAVLDIFKKHGKSSLINQYMLDDFQSLDDLSLALQSHNEDIVFLFDKPKHIGKIIKKYKTLNPEAVFITSRYNANDAFFENAKNFLNTTYFMSLPEIEDKPEMAQDIVKLRLNNIELTGLNVYGYTAVKMWAELVKKNKTFDYTELASYVKKYGFKTSWGESFYNNGNIKKPPHYLFYKYKDGEYILN